MIGYKNNKVYSIEEYISQGFTEQEAYLVRKTDCMFNNWENLTDDEKDHYYAMVDFLGLQIKIINICGQVRGQKPDRKNRRIII